jgi:signal transduction histidine kinase
MGHDDVTAELASLRGEIERLKDRRRFLGEASAALSSSLQPEAMLKTFIRLTVPAFADWAAIDLVGDDGRSQRSVVAHVRSVPDALLAASTVDAEQPGTLRALGATSSLSVPLEVRGRILGTITFCTTGSRRVYDSDDREVAEDLGQRVAVALDNVRAAQRAIRSRDELLAVVSHDLRNPLGAITMAAALLQRFKPTDDAGAKVIKHADTIQRSARRMDRLITDLLDLANIESGHLSIDPRSHDVVTLVRDVVDMMEPLAVQKRLQLRLEASPACGTMVCDRDRLLQLFSNLIGNAIKFTGENGTITVRAWRSEDAVLLAVSDTGCGIASEQLPRVFDRYWQGSEGTGRGVGLGLAISRGIVEAHGGQIRVESTVGAGTTFTIQLPVVGPLQAAARRA